MSILGDPAFWARLFGIILIDISLAGDNALVIALAVRELPPRQQFLGRIWGTVGAVGLRVAFIAAVSFLLRIPLLQLVGGLALIWIAVRLVRPGQVDHAGTRHGTSLREGIWIIIVADVTMSLDKVLGVAAAAKGDRSRSLSGSRARCRSSSGGADSWRGSWRLRSGLSGSEAECWDMWPAR